MGKRTNTIDVVQYRKTLYASLAKRNLVREDALSDEGTKSLLNDMVQSSKKLQDMTPLQISLKAWAWYKKLKPVYDDSLLEKPSYWDGAMQGLQDMMNNGDYYRSGYPFEVQTLIENDVALLMMMDVD